MNEGFKGHALDTELLAEALSFVAEHRFYLRKAVQHGDFFKAIRHCLCLANELRSSQLGPHSYYKLPGATLKAGSQLGEVEVFDGLRGVAVSRSLPQGDREVLL